MKIHKLNKITANPRNYNALVIVPSKEIVGIKLGPFIIKNLLKQIPIRSWLITISKTLWLIENWGDLSEKSQITLINEYLREENKLKALQIINNGNTIFHKPQLLITLKSLVLNGNQNGDPREINKADMKILGTALLAATDLFDKEFWRKKNEIISKDKLEKIVQELFLTGFFLKEHNKYHSIARAWHLYIDIPKELSKNNIEIPLLDIEKIFLEQVGLSIEEYLTIAIGIYSYYFRFECDEGQFPKQSDFVVFHPYYYFSDKIQKEKITKFINEISISLPDLIIEVQKQNSRELVFNSLIFKNKPFIKIDKDILVIVSLSFFIEKISTGIYWIIFDFLRRQNKDEQKQLHLKFSAYNGLLFEKYVQEVCNHIQEKIGKPEEIIVEDIKYLSSKHEEKSPDVMIIGKDYAMFFEVSATRLQAKKTLGEGSIDEFKRDFRKMIIDNVKQLDRCINDFRLNKIIINNVKNEEIKHFYPILVLIEGFPIFPGITDFIYSKLNEENLLLDKSITPLTIMDIEELEMIDRQNKISLIDLINKFHKEPKFPNITLNELLFSILPNDDGRSEGLIDGFFKQILENTVINIFGNNKLNSPD